MKSGQNSEHIKKKASLYHVFEGFHDMCFQYPKYDPKYDHPK